MHTVYHKVHIKLNEMRENLFTSYDQHDTTTTVSFLIPKT